MLVVLWLLVGFIFANFELEKGQLEKILIKAIKGKDEEARAVLRALSELVYPQEPPLYLKLYARGVLLERQGKLEEAINFYLKSIKENPYYNPSYYRFNELIRRVERPITYRKMLEDILRSRFKEPPPVIVENSPKKYLFLVEKMSQTLFLYKGKKLIGMYFVTTGKNWGDKFKEGDAKTPEGIYTFTRYIDVSKLSKDYGKFAVALNYPNPYDKILGKTGDGIWLHGSNPKDRYSIPYSTRGCIVANDLDIEKFKFAIRLEDTLIGIYKVIPTKLKLDNVKDFLRRWKEAWERKDLKTYLSLYSKSFKWKGGGLKEWKRYKRRTILGKKFIRVDLKDITILAFRRYLEERPSYYVIEFLQSYNSDTYSDFGIKRLYVAREGEELKIISEEFKKLR